MKPKQTKEAILVHVLRRGGFAVGFPPARPTPLPRRNVRWAYPRHVLSPILRVILAPLVSLGVLFQAFPGQETTPLHPELMQMET